MTDAAAFFERGWVAFPPEPRVAAWAAAAAREARRLMAANGAAYRCGGTWFPGVNILDNGADGGAAALGLPALAGAAVDFIAEALSLTGFAWDRAQISACLPGYPAVGAEETEAAFRYRRNRDAAHVDGLERVMPGRRRRLAETHGFILGLPLFGVGPGRSPMTVWEGSHEVMREAFARAFQGVAPADWPSLDVTEVYQAARRDCFERLKRREIHAEPGGAYLVHRLALHGVAAWGAEPDGAARAIAYLRPDPFPDTAPGWWLTRP